MSTKKKLFLSAAGAAGGGEPLNVEQVFSAYIHEGNQAGYVIENGVALGQSHGGGSIFVPRGEDNNIITSTNSGFAYGTGNFTWEAWIMPQVDDGTLNTTNRYVFDHHDGAGGGNLGGVSYYNGKLRYYNPTVSVQESTQALTNYTWSHVAVSRSSGTTKMFFNGTQILSFSDSYNFAEDQFVIGDFGGTGGTYSFGGLYSDVRVSDIARYTSNFTPPTSSFTSDGNTVLLTGQGPTIQDNSSNSLTLTANGDTVGKSFGYYDADDAGEGGMVWIKNRDVAYKHALFDTERGTTKLISSNLTSVTATETGSLTSFNSNGFSLGNWGVTNGSDESHVSWTFRKAPKFFDVITYSGNGSNQTISHNLGSTPGMIVVKAYNNGDDAWYVWHRSIPQFGANAQYRSVVFWDSTSAYSNYSIQTAQPDASNIYVGSTWSTSGYNYVMYVFAHNDDDGDFGPDGDQDIIKCGSYTGTGSAGIEVDLGFEPQWMYIKRTDSTSNWELHDASREWTIPGNSNRNRYVKINGSDAEQGSDTFSPTPTGFRINQGSAFPAINASGGTYIYTAIRRGPMATPTDANNVFAVETSANGSGSLPLDIIPKIPFAPDFGWVIRRKLSGSPVSILPYLGTRLTGYERSLLTDRANSEGNASLYRFDTEDAPLVGDAGGANDSGAQNIHWLWKRAPGFCDVVPYTGTGSNRTVTHNLGVAPEMIWVKGRNYAENWIVYHSATGETKYLQLNTTGAASTSSAAWNNTAPTDTNFTVGTFNAVNENGYNYIAYLFASVDGVSKVGSYTGTGSAINIDCGFTNGARFVMVKMATSAGRWDVFDTKRGIVAAADPLLSINDTTAEQSSVDYLDPYSAGFTVNGPLSDNGVTWLFYAIA